MALVAVQLTEEDAKLFLIYQKRYQFMKLLESLGVFDLKNGSAEIHFDNLGQIAKIDLHSHIKVVE